MRNVPPSIKDSCSSYLFPLTSGQEGRTWAKGWKEPPDPQGGCAGAAVESEWSRPFAGSSPTPRSCPNGAPALFLF